MLSFVLYAWVNQPHNLQFNDLHLPVLQMYVQSLGVTFSTFIHNPCALNACFNRTVSIYPILSHDYLFCTS